MYCSSKIKLRTNKTAGEIWVISPRNTTKKKPCQLRALIFVLFVYLSILKTLVPAVAGHHSGHTIRMSQHETHSHLIKPVENQQYLNDTKYHWFENVWKGTFNDRAFVPGTPECEDRSSSSSMASLVVMVVYKHHSFIRRHECPALSPVPESKQKYSWSVEC